jgi:hypothetical protein
VCQEQNGLDLFEQWRPLDRVQFLNDPAGFHVQRVCEASKLRGHCGSDSAHG